jgi:hypothetical protein
MLYKASTKTLIEVVPPDTRLPEARLRELATFQGANTDDGEPIELVALVFVGGIEDADAHVAVARRCGLEVRYLDMASGQEKVLVPGAQVRFADATDDDDDSTLVPVLREQSWPHLSTVVHRRLLDGPADVGGSWVTFGHDSAETLARLAPKQLAGRTIAEIEKLALANLSRLSFAPALVREGAVGVCGAEYCAESILLPDIMTACAELLGCELMAVAIPKANILLAVDASSFEDVAQIVGTTREVFDSADGRRISPLPLLVGQGKPIGIVSPAQRTAERSKKPWYKFW